MKQKIASNFINMVGVLFVVTLVSATALSGVYNITKDVIAEAGDSKQLESLKSVIITDYDNSPTLEKEVLENSYIELYPVKKENKLTSMVVKSVSKKGYSGDVAVMTSFLPDGTIGKVTVVSQTETPGLGTRITEPAFLSQFENQRSNSFKIKIKKEGGDVDAITGATVSSNAVVDAVLKARQAFFLKVEGGGYE